MSSPSPLKWEIFENFKILGAWAREAQQFQKFLEFPPLSIPQEWGNGFATVFANNYFKIE